MKTLESQPISKPRKIVVPIAVGLAWTNEPGYIVQEKMDGMFAIRVLGSLKCETILAGEQMRNGEFHAFDCLQYNGEDVRNLRLSERLKLLNAIFLSHSNMHLLPPEFRRVVDHADGGALLREVLARGGEGVVRKRLDGPWGVPMEACKRLETFTCVVTGMGSTQSVKISRIINGGEFREGDPSGFAEEHFYQSLETTPCGSVKLGGGKCDRVRVGSILKIEGFGLTRDGQIREPRPCKDSATSWLIQY
jgi:hypothetical protein